jgi:5-methylcytosine-specific restriction endonuclease McrA
MSFVFVVDQGRKPLDPIHPGRARFLLTAGHAAVLRRYPFTIIMKECKPDAQPQPLRVKLDPGSQTTGIAVVNDRTGQVVWAAELTHRGDQVQAKLADRRAQRKSRRQRHTRYRPARFNNRARPKGWLPPSLHSRIDNMLTWVERLRQWCPIGALSLELVKFDTQLMQDAEISGVQYQQGTLQGYEVREYLLEKWQRTCAYCGAKEVPLEVEHIVPKARHGPDRVSNLTLACEPCNDRKGTQTAAECGYLEIQAQAKRPLRDAAAVNTTRWALYERLKATGLPIETGTGGRTKWNRTRRGLPKMHWLDAACVGASTPAVLHVQHVTALMIQATGRQRRQMCLVDRSGFPRTKGKGPSRVQGFRSGDIVRAVVPTGKHAGTHVGKVAIRTKGSFNVTSHTGTVTDISYRHCHRLHAADGYTYQKEAAALPSPAVKARGAVPATLPVSCLRQPQES